MPPEPAAGPRRILRALAAAAFLAAAPLAPVPAAGAGDSPEPLFEGFEMLDPDRAPVTRSASAMEIVAGLVELPEQPLRRELLSLTVRGAERGLIVEAEVRGYLDDSLLGENFRARIVRDGGQWRLEALGRQGVCARGEKAGEPALICP